MAKRRSKQTHTSDALPSLGDVDGTTVVDRQEPRQPVPTKPQQPPKPAPKPVDVSVSWAEVRVPMIQGLNGYASPNVMTRLTGRDAEKLKAMLHGLADQNAKLADGRFVQSQQDVVRWLIQNAE